MSTTYAELLANGDSSDCHVHICDEGEHGCGEEAFDFCYSCGRACCDEHLIPVPPRNALRICEACNNRDTEEQPKKPIQKERHAA